MLEKNALFEIAEQFVHQTSGSLFITGKAGTGKTTFLKQIVRSGIKQMVVAAPTGVAAINAGGVTLHSLFQLPFGLFLPDTCERGYHDASFNVFDRQALFKNARLNATKKKLLQKMELLVIDEVSMVKADTMDAIDELLREVRKAHHTPFGGVQLLCIGDLLQLPPVITEKEWDVMRMTYKSPFFFDAKVFTHFPIISIEFDKIYRQQNQSFIRFLNQVRDNNLDPDELQSFNQTYYNPHYTPPSGDNVVTLCSHNKSADLINQNELSKLPGNPRVYEAVLDGLFPESSYPTFKSLSLKAGAQVMFIRNDMSSEKRYFNGKIGRIVSLSHDVIKVDCGENDGVLDIERDTWENIRFQAQGNKIKEEVLGKFKQFPLKPAWAVTIHKSQGLTFDRAIVDAGRSFSDGQVYVALSRLRSPEGLILKTPISMESVRSNSQVCAYLNSLPKESELIRILAEERKKYMGTLLMNCFDWYEPLFAFIDFRMEVLSIKVPDLQVIHARLSQWILVLQEVYDIGQKFILTIKKIIPEADVDGYRYIFERVTAANDYFTQKVNDGIWLDFKAYLKEIQGVSLSKKFSEGLLHVQKLTERQLSLMQNAVVTTQALVNGNDVASFITEFRQASEVSDEMLQTESLATNSFPPSTATPSNKKKSKGDSAKSTLDCFEKGQTVAEIAAIRKLNESTIYDHLISFVSSGKVKSYDLLPAADVDFIISMIKIHKTDKLADLRGLTNGKYAFWQIRLALEHLRYVSKTHR